MIRERHLGDKEDEDMRLLVAMPCLNEAQTVGDVIRSLPKDIPGVSSVDCVVIDDGSSDGTASVAKAAGAHVIRHSRCQGVGAAFRSSLAYAVAEGYDIMVNVDGDGQFDTADIPRMVAPIIDGSAGFVTASRFAKGGHADKIPFVKRWGNHRMSALVSRLTGQTFHDVSCGFRAYSRDTMLRLNLHGAFTYTQETFIDLTYKNVAIQEIPVNVKYFEERKSRVAGSIIKYASKTATIILRTYRDYYPIRFFWGLGTVFAVLGIAFAAILGVHYFQTGRFSGQIWSGFVGSFLFGIGGILYVVGIIADILASLRRNQERILYLLKKQAK